MKEKKRSKLSKFLSYVWDILFTLIVAPIVIISMIVIAKSLIYPDKIPDIFGIKPFIILDENMDKEVEYGDLVITKVVSTDELKTGDVIAFRDGNNMITLHQIQSIEEDNDKKIFALKTNENEIGSTTKIKEESVEGILTNRIKKVGIWLMFMQDVRGLIILISIVLIIGSIAYYVAERLDKAEKGEVEENTKKSKKEI